MGVRRVVGQRAGIVPKQFIAAKALNLLKPQAFALCNVICLSDIDF
jgi:hypothetical protein